MNRSFLAPRLLIIDDLLEMTHRDCRPSTKVLTLGIESDIARKYLKEQVTDCDCMTIIDHEKYAEEAQIWVRDFYFTHFPIMAHRLVKDVLQHGGDVNHLAYLKFFERTPFHGNLTSSLYWLALVKLTQDSVIPSHVDVIIRHDSSFRELFSVKRSRRLQWKPTWWLTLQLTRFFLFHLSLAWNRSREQVKPVSLGDFSESLFFTIYPHWWVSNGTQEKTERFFPEQVLASKANEAKYLIWFQGKNYNSDLQFLKQQLKIDFIVLNEFGKLSDFLVILKRLRNLRILHFMNSSLRYSGVTFHSFDIGGLIHQELIASLARGEFIQSHLIELAMSRVCRERRPRNVVFRFENQPIDHAIVGALRDFSEVASVGYWHTALSLSQNYIPLWQMASFWSRTGLSKSDQGLWPDFMLVPNQLCKESLLREGFSPDKTFQILPTRHVDLLTSKFAALKSNKEAVRRDKNDVIRILVSFSANKETSVLLVSTVLRCLSSMAGRYQIGIRPHPAWTFDDSELQQTLISRESTSSLKVIRDMKELYDWIPRSEVLITPGSQLALESIYLGTLPIIFEPKSIFNPTDFSCFSRSCLIVSDLESLETALVKVISQDSSLQAVMSNWSELMDSFLGEASSRAVRVDSGQVMSVLSGLRFSHD